MSKLFCTEAKKALSSPEGANPVALPVRVCTCVSLKAMRDPWDSPVAGLQTGWHPQSSFFILETAVVSVTTRSANEGVGEEAVDGGGCRRVHLWIYVCVCVCIVCVHVVQLMALILSDNIPVRFFCFCKYK